MSVNEKNKSTSHFLVLAGLWFINILIVIFGLPFLLFKKIKNLFAKPAKKSPPAIAENSNSQQYFPHQIDSKL